MSPAPDVVLEMNHIRLRYPGSQSWTLDGLDLRLKAGERLALVGPSGCGKSTIARAALQLLPSGSHCSGGLSLMGRDPRKDDNGGEVYVYRRAGLPCYICGTPISHRVVEGRNMFWCPGCQR